MLLQANSRKFWVAPRMVSKCMNDEVDVILERCGPGLIGVPPFAYWQGISRVLPITCVEHYGYTKLLVPTTKHRFCVHPAATQDPKSEG